MSKGNDESPGGLIGETMNLFHKSQFKLIAHRPIKDDSRARPP